MFRKKKFWADKQYTLFHFYVHWFLLEKCFDLFRTLLKQFDPTTLHRIHFLEAKIVCSTLISTTIKQKVCQNRKIGLNLYIYYKYNYFIHVIMLKND
ncbi:hypothetical protein BJI61_02450 [Acinetobacter baumannii]|nr:hypothetical protein AQ482_18060 [Acinetobacter baumannii]KWR97704.1 hypothetical protein AVO40_16955 [Acinetobacter baumannii]RQL48743.1 hypothetical protein BJI61_02450 [Acinetobacter baumannii]